MKNELMNNCIVDAVIYAGAGGQVIRQAVAEAIEFVLLDQTTPEKSLLKGAEPRLVFISESLGRKVLFDVLTQAEQRSKARNKKLSRTLAHTDQVFMGANQLPLLELP